MANAINMVWELFVEGVSSEKENEGKKKRERKERKRGKEKIEKGKKRCKANTDGRRSSEVVIVKKANMWP